MAENFTPLICSECGEGHYKVKEWGLGTNLYRCVLCGHELTSFDLVLDEGEREGTRHSILGVLTEES